MASDQTRTPHRKIIFSFFKLLNWSTFLSVFTAAFLMYSQKLSLPSNHNFKYFRVVQGQIFTVFRRKDGRLLPTSDSKIIASRSVDSIQPVASFYYFVSRCKRPKGYPLKILISLSSVAAKNFRIMGQIVFIMYTKTQCSRVWRQIMKRRYT